MTAPETDIDDIPSSESDTTDPETTSAEPSSEEEPEKLTCEVKVDSRGACQRHVTVSISREDVDRYLDKAFTEMMPSAEISGFRPGRAPRKLVESRFREDVSERVKGSLLMDSLSQVTEDQDFSAISEPDFDFDAIDLPQEGPMTFEFDLEVRPEFDLPNWKGIKIEKPIREHSDDDVDAQLKKLLAGYSQLVSVDGPAEDSDYLVLNIRCKQGAKVLSTLDDITAEIRPTLSFHDANVEGFDKLLTGAVSGDSREATTTIGDEAETEELRGEEVTIEFEVTEVKRREMPDLDADFLSNLGSFDDEGELRTAVKANLDRQLTYHQQRRVREQITESLTESADWELPPDLLKRQSHRELERAVLEMKSSGFAEEDIRAYENRLRQNSLESTELALKEHFILERIAEEEKIEASDADYDYEVAMIAAQSNESARRVRARLEKRGQMDSLRNQIVERKVVDLITEEATFKEVPFESEDSKVSEVSAVNYALAGRQADDSIPEAKGGGEKEELRQKADRD